MAWRVLWGTVFGEPVEEFLSPFTATIVFFVLVMGLGISLRTLNKLFTPRQFRSYVADFVSTMEMCAYFFENNFILKNYGFFYLFFAVVIQIVISNRTFEGSSENPCKALHEYLRGNCTLISMAISIVTQTVAGVASYRLAKVIWALDMVKDHRERFYETDCNSDLNTALMVGFGLEMAASLLDSWLSMQTLHRESIIDEIIKAGTGSFMIVMGIEMTGMYFNPAMAFGHTFGCKGSVAYEHLLVYWMGPFLGCYVSTVFDGYFHIDQLAPPGDKKTK